MVFHTSCHSDTTSKPEQVLTAYKWIAENYNSNCEGDVVFETP